MKTDTVKIKLKDGREGLIFSAFAADAADVLYIRLKAAGETEFLTESLEEIDSSKFSQGRALRLRAKAPGYLTLIARVDGLPAGLATMSPYGSYMRVMHRGTLSISVLEEYWGLGIGSALLKAVIQAAKDFGYRQLELNVDSQNTRAIALYEKYGFVICGRVASALKHSDGEYYDELTMVLPLSSF